MKKIIYIAGALLLSACGTTVTANHMSCMNSYTDFANQVACVQNAVDNDPYLRGDALTQEYMMTGDVLLADVRAGKISEEEARLRFIEKLNRIESEQLRREADFARINRDRFPRQTTCVPVGDTTRCTTF